MNQTFVNFGESISDIPWVTQDMVQSRTVELALQAGRKSHEIKQCDYERAKRELTGETDSARQRAMIDPGT